MSDDPEIEIGLQIKLLREAVGLSQEQLAQMAGTNQQTVQRIESLLTTRSKATPKILAALKEIDFSKSNAADEVSKAYMAALDYRESRTVEKKHYPIKKPEIIAPLKLLENFETGNKIKLIFATEKEPGIISPGIKGASTEFYLQDALRISEHSFAMYIPLSDMSPEFEPGDIILADASSPPIPNVTCLFAKGSGIGAVYTIRRLISSTKTDWRVKCWSPERELELARSDWPVCIRVVGRLSRK